MFVDDYLNSLAVGSSMRDLTDKYRISREKLAYVVDSTAAPVSVIIPYSTWGAFFGGLLVANGVAAEGQGLAVYISAIPYMLYAWVAIFIVPAVIAGWIPSLGPMKTADQRAASTGQTVPPGAEHVEKANQLIQPKEGLTPRISLFVLPMLALVGATGVVIESLLTGTIQDAVPDRYRAGALGLADTIMVGACLVGSLVAPTLARYAGPRPALLFVAVAALLPVLAAWRRPTRRPSTPYDAAGERGAPTAAAGPDPRGAPSVGASRVG